MIGCLRSGLTRSKSPRMLRLLSPTVPVLEQWQNRLSRSPPVSHRSERHGRGLARIGCDQAPRVSACATVVEHRDRGGVDDRFTVAGLNRVDALTKRTWAAWTDHHHYASVGLSPTRRCAKLNRAMWSCGVHADVYGALGVLIPYTRLGPSLAWALRMAGDDRNRRALAQSRPFEPPNRCPECAHEGHVVIERAVSGTYVVTSCLCRICGHTWQVPAWLRRRREVRWIERRI